MKKLLCASLFVVMILVGGYSIGNTYNRLDCKNLSHSRYIGEKVFWYCK